MKKKYIHLLSRASAMLASSGSGLENLSRLGDELFSTHAVLFDETCSERVISCGSERASCKIYSGTTQIKPPDIMQGR